MISFYFTLPSFGIGQKSVLQISLSLLFPRHMAELAEGTIHDLVLCFVPPSQVFVHLCQLFQVPHEAERLILS